MARTANKHRQKLRPDDPKGFDFIIDEDYVPENFLRGDVTVKERRHLILATDKQLKLLANAKTWYVKHL